LRLISSKKYAALIDKDNFVLLVYYYLVNYQGHQGQSQFKWLSPKITRATILNNGKDIKNSESAKPMLLTFPRLKAR